MYTCIDYMRGTLWKSERCISKYVNQRDCKHVCTRIQSHPYIYQQYLKNTKGGLHNTNTKGGLHNTTHTVKSSHPDSRGNSISQAVKITPPPPPPAGRGGRGRSM